MFGDDFLGGGIEDLFNKLSGQNSSVEYSSVGSDGTRRVRKRMQRDVFGKVLLDKVSTKKKLHFIFDYSGKEDITASVQDEITEDDYGETVATGKKVLEVKEGSSVIANFPLSSEIRSRGSESSFVNGVLEVSFKK